MGKHLTLVVFFIPNNIIIISQLSFTILIYFISLLGNLIFHQKQKINHYKFITF
jgi:hypothetical protein